jgi:alkane 1-monooxygenase
VRPTALRNLMPYGLAFVVPLMTFSFLAIGTQRGPGVLLWLAALPLLVFMDRLAGRARPAAAGLGSGNGYLAILLGLALLQGVNIFLAVGQTFQRGRELPEAVTAVILLAASSAHTLLVAHELIHKPRRSARWLGRLLLWSLLYDHFFTEHLRGHHARAGTAEDPSTAAFDEPFWPYLRRAWPGEWCSAWRLEMRRLTMYQGASRWLRSTVLHGAAAQLVLLSLVGVLAGGLALAGFLIQALLAQLLIQVVNYLEHWGLRRGTRVGATDSWESDSRFAQFALLGLARHADHHCKASRPYQQLGWHDESPRLPRAHLVMVALVLFQNRRARQLLADELRRKGLAA